MKATYKSGQPIEVEVYNFEKRKSEWVAGIFRKTVQATDIAFRYEVEIGGRLLEGFQAAHPECVRSIKKN